MLNMWAIFFSVITLRSVILFIIANLKSLNVNGIRINNKWFTSSNKDCITWIKTDNTFPFSPYATKVVTQIKKYFFLHCRQNFKLKKIKSKVWKTNHQNIFYFSYLFHARGPYNIETSPLICSENKWTGFYLIRTSVMKE